MLDAVRIGGHCGTASKKRNSDGVRQIPRKKLRGRRCWLEPHRALNCEHGSFGRGVCVRVFRFEPLLGEFGIPVAERFLPVGTLERIKLIQNAASFVEMAEIQVRFDQIIADLKTVNCKDKMW